MEIVAKLDTVNEVVERKEFKSRKVWLTTDGQYPQTIEVEVAGDKIGLFDNIGPGSEVKAYINLRGRKWTNNEGKTSVFNTLAVWKVEVISGAKVSDSIATSPVMPADYQDDLPF